MLYRQRLYVDVGRPRPFYRTTNNAHHENTTTAAAEIIHQNPLSLQVWAWARNFNETYAIKNYVF